MPRDYASVRISREECARRIEIVEECLSEGFPLHPNHGRGGGGSGNKGAIAEAADRCELTFKTFSDSLKKAKRLYDLEPDESKFVPRPAPEKPKPIFAFDHIPGSPKRSAEELILARKSRSQVLGDHDRATSLYKVRINIEGPVLLAPFGDPHVDDDGCDWNLLEHHVQLARDTPGVLAINGGDTTNNWVGRLQRLYAMQDVTSDDALTLIEWLMTALPWLLQIGGNHDLWNTEKGDVAAVFQRMHQMPGLYEGVGARLQLLFSNGSSVNVNARHDFSGASQYNAAHALVRQTLFDFRDHILIAAHRHQTGYMPIWFNEPRRLCHGVRVGSYKVRDHYAKEKGFKDENWAKVLPLLIDPAYAHDPVRHIKPIFDFDEACEELTWKRQRFEMGKST